jgi:hypothetical protein
MSEYLLAITTVLGMQTADLILSGYEGRFIFQRPCGLIAHIEPEKNLGWVTLFSHGERDKALSYKYGSASSILAVRRYNKGKDLKVKISSGDDSITCRFGHSFAN